MIGTSLDIFREHLRKIVNHINDATKREALINKASSLDPIVYGELRAHKNQEVEFRYKAVVISAYGAFEKFIELILEEYIHEQSKLIPKFSRLDKRIQDNYIDNWKTLHGNLQSQKFSDLKEEELVMNLYQVIHDDSSGIMPECYMKLNGNYKSSVIHEMLLGIGVNNDEMRKYYHVQLEDPITFNTLVEKLDELVARRHVIAHTPGKQDDLVDDEILLMNIGLLQIYAETLCAFLRDKLLERKWIAFKDYQEVITPHNARDVKHVLTFNDVKNFGIMLNQQALVQLPEETYPRYIETKVDGITIQEKEEDETASVEKLDATKSYFEVSMHFESPDVIKRHVKIAAIPISKEE